ncbi:unnamed protein product [Phytophthora fragariaefolia]|uniref:Unnamed protein product n=1 Tax=Phytophthora fragariaefolia TaxID=1490495 RepID=A0A9W7CGP1_9STRA|nr:unnamed protein product [Phytophthora fragariaefolia]
MVVDLPEVLNLTIQKPNNSHTDQPTGWANPYAHSLVSGAALDVPEAVHVLDGRFHHSLVFSYLIVVLQYNNSKDQVGKHNATSASSTRVLSPAIPKLMGRPRRCPAAHSEARREFYAAVFLQEDEDSLSPEPTKRRSKPSGAYSASSASAVTAAAAALLASSKLTKKHKSKSKSKGSDKKKSSKRALTTQLSDSEEPPPSYYDDYSTGRGGGLEDSEYVTGCEADVIVVELETDWMRV